MLSFTVYKAVFIWSHSLWLILAQYNNQVQCLGNFHLRHGEAYTLVQKVPKVGFDRKRFSSFHNAVVLRGMTFWVLFYLAWGQSGNMGEHSYIF